MKKKFDPLSVAGILLGFALITISILLTRRPAPETGYDIVPKNLGAFLDLPSVMIVVGGTFAALMVSFPLNRLTRIPKHLRVIFMPTQYHPIEYIDKLVDASKKVRTSGLLSLEADLEDIQDVFMKNSLQMLVDGVDPTEVRTQMEGALDSLDERHAQERAFYDRGASLAPAFGMVGTLIGLINMLKSLEDVSTVGPNMSVALITTLYGTLLANLFFTPISSKLSVRHDEEYLCMQIVYEGVKSIQLGLNPKLLNEKLINMLPEFQKKKLFATAEKSGGKQD